MARLLLVHHSPTPALVDLRDAVRAGAETPEIEGVDVVVREALSPDPEEVARADGVLLLTPANFGYMSGALKHFFDVVFLQAGGSLAADGSATTSGGRTPFGLLVHGRYDTTGAVRSVLAIAQGLGWQQAADVVEVLGDVDEQDRVRAHDLGATLAALLSD